MSKWDKQKTPYPYCFSLVFINNLINDISKHNKNNVTIFIILTHPSYL